MMVGAGGADWVKKTGATRVMYFPTCQDADLMRAVKTTAMDYILALANKTQVPNLDWLKTKIILSKEMLAEVSNVLQHLDLDLEARLPLCNVDP